MILVTGASGFLGRHLLKILNERNLLVRALYHSNLPSEDFGENIRWVPCNLLDVIEVEEAMKEVTIVFHCAAIVSFDPRKSEDMIGKNVAYTANIVNAAIEQGVGKFIHVSSVAALGRALPDPDSDAAVFVDEETAWLDSKQNSPYAKSKYLSELEVWRGIAEGLKAVIVNPSLILGAGDWDKGSAHLMKIVDQEFKWYTQGINGWVDVQDVVNAMVLLMEGNIQSERFILNGGNFSYQEIFTKMANELGKKPPQKNAGKWMTELVWRWEIIKSRLAGKEATISKASARTAQAKCFYNNEKFLKEFPEFHYTTIDATIQRMAQNYLNDQKE